MLNLQDQIESVETAIRDASKEIARGARTSATRRAKASIGRLRTKQDQLVLEATELYESLNIDGDFQEISGHGLEFTSTLLQAHEAKRTCRERLVERFHEWSRLDLASGGTDEPLGTRAHQRAKQALQKRGPALQRAIQRYNNLCARLALLSPAGSNFPLPEPLSTDLALLRDDGSYLQDVFLSHSVGPAPAWITDPTLRHAIRAMHVLDRCDEEQVRLLHEISNFTGWLGDEISAVCTAMQRPQCAHFTYSCAPPLDPCPDSMLTGPLSRATVHLESLVHSAVRAKILAPAHAQRFLATLHPCLPMPEPPFAIPHLPSPKEGCLPADSSGASSSTGSESGSNLEEFVATSGGYPQAASADDDDLDLVHTFADLAVGASEPPRAPAFVPISLRFEPPTTVPSFNRECGQCKLNRFL